VALAAAILLLFMLPTSSAIWQASRLLQITQHPGRIFSIFATLELLAIIACVGHLTRQPRFTARRQAVAALLALLSAGASVHDRYRVRDRLDYSRFRFDAARSFEDMTHNHELQPKAARIEGLPQRVSAQVPIAQTGDGTRLTIQSQRDDDIFLQAAVVSAPASVTLNQFAFPGWRLTLDERRLPRCGESVTACWQPDEHGRIRILLPASGSVALHAWFDGPPDWLARTAAGLIALVLGIAALRRLDRLVVRPVPSS
ncbi:MAG: hypothetical protein ACREU7_05435, partial [Burkholderiales bacterium]